MCGEFLKKKRGEVGLGRKKKVLLFLFLFLTHESVIRKKKIKTLCKNENCLAHSLLMRFTRPLCSRTNVGKHCAIVTYSYQYADDRGCDNIGDKNIVLVYLEIEFTWF